MKEIGLLQKKLLNSENNVGTKKLNDWKLPPIEFAYGKKEKPDPEGVSIITRSWVEHKQSCPIDPPQDFLQINKQSIKMNATNHSTHKDYRENINIKRNMRTGTNDRKIYLPSEDFVYGRKNRTPTPIKQVINFDYAKKAEEIIKMEYNHFLAEKSNPNSKPRIKKVLKNKKNKISKEKVDNVKPVYKMKMFMEVDSKVKNALQKFKTYKEKKDNLDFLIEKVEKELNDINKDDNNITNTNQ